MAGSTSGISPSFLGLSRSSGQVTHVLLTRSRLCPRPKPGSSLHLHVLSTPPAFVLSQDQTLREELLSESCRASHEGAAVHVAATGCVRRGLFQVPCDAKSAAGVDEPGRIDLLARRKAGPIGAHAVEFSKTVAPRGRKGLLRLSAPRISSRAGIGV